MGKHRVYEIAKELGKTNQEVIDVLAKNNIQVKSLSTVDDSAKDLVVRAFTKKPVQPEKKPAPQPKPQNSQPRQLQRRTTPPPPPPSSAKPHRKESVTPPPPPPKPRADGDRRSSAPALPPRRSSASEAPPVPKRSAKPKI